MSKYSDFVQYFENLATYNIAISHGPNSKKFYRMNIEELLSGIKNDLPSPASGPFMIFINYIRELNHVASFKDKKQFMFFIMQGYSDGDWDEEQAARDATEIVVDQILTRMVNDSTAGNPIFNYSFDKIDGVKIIPTELKANLTYVGWQVSFNLDKQYIECYDPSKWND